MDYVCPEADVIVLAGDIATYTCYDSIVKQYGDCGKTVIYVAGNHEAWGKTVEDAREERLKLFQGTNIVELDCHTYIMGDVAFIGATLWTNLDSPGDAFVASKTKDFNAIKDMTPDKWGRLHHRHRGYITYACASPNLEDKKKVVVTHYLPSFRSTPSRFKGDPTNCIFSSNCDDIMHMRCAPDIWIHGHTHDSFDYKNGDTRVICNPYGYWGHQTNGMYKPDLLIEV
jgi:predicted phosphodiesterase